MSRFADAAAEAREVAARDLVNLCTACIVDSLQVLDLGHARGVTVLPSRSVAFVRPSTTLWVCDLVLYEFAYGTRN